MLEAARTSETSVGIQLRTWHYIPEDSELQTGWIVQGALSRPSTQSIKGGIRLGVVQYSYLA
jgi:hypothetical protein